MNMMTIFFGVPCIQRQFSSRMSNSKSEDSIHPRRRQDAYASASQPQRDFQRQGAYPCRCFVVSLVIT
jgi:hypothetical protein